MSEDSSDTSIQTGDISKSSNIAIGNNSSVNVVNIYIQDSQIASGNIGNIFPLISKAVDDRVEKIRTTWREGNRNSARSLLKTIKEPTQWSLLSTDLQSKILRLEVGLMLDQNEEISDIIDFVEVQQDNFLPDDYSKVQALICYKKGSINDALEKLLSNKDADSEIFRAALWLELGDSKKCLELLNSEFINKPENKQNAEISRIKALAFLQEQNLLQAYFEIQEARNISGSWESIKFAEAIICYFSTLSPIVLQEKQFSWPTPVPITMVKTDDESLDRLERAKSLFEELMQLPDKSEEEQMNFRIWHLACLLNNFETREEGIQKSKEILFKNPTETRVMAWVIVNNLGVSLEKCKKALKQIRKNECAEIPHIIALVQIYLSENKHKGAKYLLEQCKQQFAEAGLANLWIFWLIQVFIKQRKPEKALEYLENMELDEVLTLSKLVALYSFSEINGDWEELEFYLRELYAVTKDCAYLFDLCKIYMRQSKWDAVLPYDEDILKGVQTSEALRMISIAAYNANKPSQTIDYLNRSKLFFSKGILPSDLSQLKISCKVKLGIIPEAISDAEKQLQVKPSIENYLNLIDIFVQKGDFSSIQFYVRRLVHFYDYNLPSYVMLYLANIVYQDDVEFGKRLWRSCIKDIPDELVGKALDIGYRLGLDSEITPLFIRMQYLGQSGRDGIQLLTIEDVKSVIINRQESVISLDEMYKKGDMPIHLLEEGLGISLINLLHSNIVNNLKESSFYRKYPLFVRHGGRISNVDFLNEHPTLRLNIDITSLLIAEEFDLLEFYEEFFQPLRISQYLISSLMKMREETADHQPSVSQKQEKVLAFIEKGKIGVVDSDSIINEEFLDGDYLSVLGRDWLCLFQNAKNNEGYLIDYLPKTIHGVTNSPELPSESESILTNCEAVIGSLRKNGRLTEVVSMEVVNHIDQQKNGTFTAPLPELGTSIYFWGNTIETQYITDNIDLVCDYFKVYVNKSEFETLRQTAQERKQKIEENKVVRNLLNRINRGIDDGLYQIMPNPVKVDEKEDDFITNPSLGCIAALLETTSYEEQDVILIDDRHINAYIQSNGAPILCTMDVVKYLVSTTRISESEYFNVFHQMRSANLRYFPLGEDEILYHLTNAKVHDGKLIETQELKTLREYFSSSYFQGKTIQRPPMKENSPNEFGEVEYVIHFGRVIANVLVQIWNVNSDGSDYKVWSDWIMDSLFVDHSAISEVISWKRPNQDDAFLLAVSLVQLMSQSVTMDVSTENHRRDYLEWLYYRHLSPRFNANPKVFSIFIDNLKSLISQYGTIENDKNSKKEVVISFMQQWIEDFPKPIINEFRLDNEFMNLLGYFSVVDLGDWTFSPDDFYSAIENAKNNKEASLKLLDSDSTVFIKSGEYDNDFILSCSDSDEEIPIHSDNFELLSHSPHNRRRYLIEKRRNFDCDDETFERVLLEINSKEDAQSRIITIEEWQNSNLDIHFEKLYQSFKATKVIDKSKIRPRSVDSLFMHYRLEKINKGNNNLQERIGLSSEKLINEIGWCETFSRYSGLPIPLPGSLIKYLSCIGVDERNKLVNEVLTKPISPIGIIHLQYLVHIVPGVTRKNIVQAKKLIEIFLINEEHLIEAYLAILKWVYMDCQKWIDTRLIDFDVQLIFVWSIATKLFLLMEKLHIPCEWSEEFFTISEYSSIINIFEDTHDVLNDVANPTNVTLHKLIVTGFQYCYGETVTKYLGEDMLRRLEELLMIEINDTKLPDIFFFMDLDLMRNSCGSFLGWKYSQVIESIPGFESVKILVNTEKEAFIIENIQFLLQDPEYLSGWRTLIATLHNSPAYEGARKQLTELIFGTDFVQLHGDDFSLGTQVFHFVSQQSMYMKNEKAIRKLSEELILIAEKLNSPIEPEQLETGGNISRDQAFGLLLDAARNLSVCSNESVNSFSKLVLDMVNKCPPMADVARSVVQNLYIGLPVEQSKAISKLLLQLRMFPN